MAADKPRPLLQNSLVHAAFLYCKWKLTNEICNEKCLEYGCNCVIFMFLFCNCFFKLFFQIQCTFGNQGNYLSKAIVNAVTLRKIHSQCLSFWHEGITYFFPFTWNHKFSLTIGMIMPLGWGEVTGIIPKLVTQGPFWFPTRHSWLRHLWLVGNPNGLSWLVGNYFFLSLVASHS